MAFRYWVGGAGDWSDTAHWSTSSGGAGGASVPTASDDVRLDNNSNLISDAIRLTADAVCASFVGSGGPYWQLNCQNTYRLTINSGGGQIFRCTVINPAPDYVFILKSGTHRIYDSVPGVQIETGTVTLDVALISTAVLNVVSGTLDTGGYGVSATRVKVASGASLTLGASLVQVTGVDVGGASAWDMLGALSAGTSTIKFTNTSAAARTFNGGGKTYNDVWFAGAYTGTLFVNGSNTFNDLKSDAGLHTIHFAGGSTQTVSTFTLGGTGGSAKTTLRSQADGASWNLVKATGSVVCDWVDLRDSHASGGASFTATNSMDGGGNSGWTITAPPVFPFAGGPARRAYIRR
ncbi:MAG: hypothetical protein AB7I59_18135 [Geminicoccaceae bacterium]|uniref:hypothetical protein n=1 Tax=Reyranella sp. TaxID=1929291 RepID=UPI003D0D8616